MSPASGSLTIWALPRPRILFCTCSFIFFFIRRDSKLHKFRPHKPRSAPGLGERTNSQSSSLCVLWLESECLWVSEGPGEPPLSSPQWRSSPPRDQGRVRAGHTGWEKQCLDYMVKGRRKKRRGRRKREEKEERKKEEVGGG